MRLNEVADFTRIQPFPDATNETSLYIGTKVSAASEARFARVPLEIWSPRVTPRINPRAELPRVIDQTAIANGVACPVGTWGSPLWTGDELAFREARALRGCSQVYLDASHRGTVTDLARVYWVKVERY